MKTEGYVDRSLDDFIKANRGMFRRGRGGAAGRGAASSRGGRGRGRGAARGRSSSRGSTRGSGRGRSLSRGVPRGAARGRATSRGRARGRGSVTRGSRGQRGAGRPARGTRGSRATFGQRWRAASARMGSHLESAAPASSAASFKRKQLAVKTFRGSKLAGRLGTPSKGVKRLTTLALKKKRQALQQLTSGRQLTRADARNRILMKRRGLTEVAASTARRGRGASRAGSRATVAPSRRPPPQGLVQVIHESVAPAANRQRRPLNRNRVTDGSVTGPSGASLLTVQFKNDIAVRQRRPPPPLEMDLDDELPLPPSAPPPPPPPPPRNRAGLDPRIQQEIAAIQARGRSQHHLSESSHAAGVSNFRPTAAASSRTLNDRFTADRVIFS